MNLTAAVKEDSLERITDRNSRTLFLKFSEEANITCQESIRSIVPKATSIRIPSFCARNKFFKNAFIELKSKEEAIEHYNLLQNYQLPVGTVSADFLKEETNINLKVDPYRLYVTGIPKEATIQQLKALFPNAYISRNESSKFRNKANFKTYAYITFKTVKDARNAFWAGKSMEIHNQQLLVLYAGTQGGHNLKPVPGSLLDKSEKREKQLKAKESKSEAKEKKVSKSQTKEKKQMKYKRKETIKE